MNIETVQYRMTEVWQIINDFPDYMISNYGHVWSNKTNRYLKLINHNSNNMIYKKVDLMKDGVRHQGKLVHRLVAEAFIDNPLGLTDVDHLNGITSDNHFTNLEWKTHRDNMINHKIRTDNSSGISGVSWDRRGSSRNPATSKHWKAKIFHNGSEISKLFKTLEEATEWRYSKEQEFGYNTR